VLEIGCQLHAGHIAAKVFSEIVVVGSGIEHYVEDVACTGFERGSDTNDRGISEPVTYLRYDGEQNSTTRIFSNGMGCTIHPEGRTYHSLVVTQAGHMLRTCL